jgi:hypothetical protein
MWIYEPKNFVAAGEDRLFTEGYMHMQKSRMEHALAHATAIPSGISIAEAVAFIEEVAGIKLTSDQLLAILSLYPMARGKLADYGWGDTEIREIVAGVVANFMTGSRWPTGQDDVDATAFVERLKKAATFMGYAVSTNA